MSSDSKPAAFSNSNEPPPVAHAASESESGNGAGYASYPKLDPKDVAPVANTWSSTQSGSPPAPTSVEYIGATAVPSASNPYVSAASAPSSSLKNNMDKVRDALGKWGKKAADATKRAEDLAGNMWQHLKTGPSVADAAVGKIAQSTKVLAEGGYEKVFQNTFETGADEKLLKSYGCYLSTSAGPIVGVLYLSNEKVAFCSDSPISYKASEEVQYSYYKVIIPLNQLTAVNPSVSRANPSEKYIQIISVDNHEFWFMGFVNYDSAVKNLQDAVRTRPI